jgi:predicted RNase H-like nuclease (RuvC/YqgF family)
MKELLDDLRYGGMERGGEIADIIESLQSASASAKKDVWEDCETCHGIVDGKRQRIENLEREVERLRKTTQFLRSERPMARRLTELESELSFTRDVIQNLVDDAKLTSSQYELCRQALYGKKPNGN